jgi:hypothetical protein
VFDGGFRAKLSYLLDPPYRVTRLIGLGFRTGEHRSQAKPIIRGRSELEIAEEPCGGF